MAIREKFKSALELTEHASFLREWLWPFIAPLVVGAVGYLQSERWMWILVSMSVVFAFVTMGFAIMMLYLERKSPLNKLQSTVIFQCDLTPASTVPRLPFVNRAQKRAQKSTGDVIALSPTQLDPSVQRTIDRAQL